MATRPNRLRPCYDCGTELSPTAKTCGKCASTDPFGMKRADEKIKATLILIAIVIALAFFGAWKWKSITPLDVVHGDFHKLFQ